jgi:hypothetical protein
MALEVTQVHRNLHQRVTWLYLEIEDMFLILGLGVLANFIGRFLGREIYGIPLSFLLLWVVPILAIPCLWLFKYGKPRGYATSMSFLFSVMAFWPLLLRAGDLVDFLFASTDQLFLNSLIPAAFSNSEQISASRCLRNCLNALTIPRSHTPLSSPTGIRWLFITWRNC